MNGNANQQLSQRHQRRDGYSSAPSRPNFRAQPAHTNALTRSDNVLQTPVYGQTGGGVIPYTAAATNFQQAVVGAYPQGQPTAIYQNIVQPPYYTLVHYCGTPTVPTTAYMAATTGVPQTFVMPQQQHHQQQAVHQQMANVVVTTSSTGQQQVPSSTAHQQQQPSEKKILVFCDPKTKQELNLLGDVPINDAKRTEEADKTTSSKHLFLKQVRKAFEGDTVGGNLMKAVAGNANDDGSGGGEAAPAVNPHPTSAKSEVTQTLIILQQQQQAVHQQTVEKPPVVISPPAEDEEEEAVPGNTETMGGGSRKGSQNDLNGEEESAADQLTPTQDGSEEMTEERIRELEEQMQLLEKSDENNDPEQFVYSRKFLYFIRKVTLAFKTVNCPKTEDELEELGLSRRGMPAVQAFSAGKAKRFDGASSDQFKTAWQQPGGGLNQFGTGSDARFTTTRPPYSGRHSDNKLKPKKVIASWGPIARQSLDQRPLKLEQTSSSQAAELSKRSSNAWKPKREERFDMNAPTRDEDQIKYEKLCKDVRGLLNKVTPSTYKDLSEDFIQYKIQEDPKLLEMIIDLIFDKAVEEPHFCPLYSDLCKRQVEEEKRTMADKQTQDKSFRTELIQKCQKTFLVSDQFDEKISELKKKIDELGETDEKGRARLEEEIESRRSKEKRRLLGIIRFISQLYRHHLLIDQIVYWCAIELIKRNTLTKDEVYIEYAVELLETVGKVYEKRQTDTQRSSASVAPDQKVNNNQGWRADCKVHEKRQTDTQRSSASAAPDQKNSFSLDSIFHHFATLKKEMSNRIRFAIMDLEELRNNKWMPRGGEKGPKTIEEVREEVEKEQQENELERIEHDNKQKEREKIQLMSRKKPHPGYGGRNSVDRRPVGAANAASLHTASKVESRISGTSRLKDVDNVSGLGGSRMKFDHNRERMPKKEDDAAPTSTGGAAGGGGGTSSSGTAWRSKRGTDTSKDSSNQGGGD
ncbi:hypothetical protein GPALN_011418 [Globodera pallida]|nr:hypothetical protein GPALN_011418 [Globodera pallida]